MLRTLLLLIVFVLVIGIALVMTGVVNLRQEGNSVSLETRDIEVAPAAVNVQVPAIRLENRQVEVPSVRVGDAGGNSH